MTDHSGSLISCMTYLDCLSLRRKDNGVYFINPLSFIRMITVISSTIL